MGKGFEDGNRGAIGPGIGKYTVDRCSDGSKSLSTHGAIISQSVFERPEPTNSGWAP